MDKLKVPFFSGDFDHRDHITTFNIAMGRTHFTAEEKDVIYCQLFVENPSGPASTWFSRLEENSANIFHDIYTEFLKQYSMFI